MHKKEIEICEEFLRRLPQQEKDRLIEKTTQEVADRILTLQMLGIDPYSVRVEPIKKEE